MLFSILYRMHMFILVVDLKMYLTARNPRISVDESVLEEENSLMYTYSTDDGTLVVSSVNKGSYLREKEMAKSGFLILSE